MPPNEIDQVDDSLICAIASDKHGKVAEAVICEDWIEVIDYLKHKLQNLHKLKM